MIDINSSLYFQLVNFIVLLLALNIILFKPLLRTMQEREQGIANAFTDAKSAQERMQQLNKARAEISAAAASARTDLKKEAEALSQNITAKLLGRAV